MMITTIIVPNQEHVKERLCVVTPVSSTPDGFARFINKFGNHRDFWWLWSDGEDIKTLTSDFDITRLFSQVDIVFEYNPSSENWQVIQPDSKTPAFRSWMSVEDFLKFFNFPMQECKRVCPLCHRVYKMSFTTDEWHALGEWNRGEVKIQDAFPKLNPVERDWLKSGYCPNCQDLIGLNPDKTDRISII